MIAEKKKVKVLLSSQTHFAECRKCNLYKEKECMACPDSLVGECMTPALDIIYKNKINTIYVVCHDFCQNDKTQKG